MPRPRRLSPDRKLAVFAVLALITCASLAWWWASARQTAASLAPRLEGSPARRSSALASPQRPSPGPERLENVASVGHEPTAPEDERWYEYALELTVVDEHGWPVHGAIVQAFPARHPANHAGLTGAEGRLELTWRGRLETMPLTLAAEHHGHGETGYRGVRLEHGAASVTLALRPPNEHSVRVLRLASERRGLERVLEDAPPSPALQARLETLRRSEAEMRDLARRPATRSRWNRGLESRTGRDRRGRVTFRSPVEDRSWDPHGATRADAAPATSGDARLSGWVFTDALEPATDCPVRARSTTGAGAWTARTDRAGFFAIEELPTCALHVRAGGGERGLAVERLDIRSGERLEWAGVLDRGLELAGRVVDERGRPLDGWLVELVGTGSMQSWLGGAMTRSGGRFVVTNLPAGPLRALVRAPGAWRGVPVAIVDLGSTAERVERRVTDTELPSATVAVRVAAHDGRAIDDAEVYLWHISSGRGLVLDPQPRQGSYRSDPQPPGSYVVSATHRTYGHVESAPIELASGDGLELGELVFERPGRLGLEDAVGAQVWRRRPDVDVWVAEARESGSWEGELPPGDYSVELPDGRRFPVTVRPGARFELRVPPAGDR